MTDPLPGQSRFTRRVYAAVAALKSLKAAEKVLRYYDQHCDPRITNRLRRRALTRRVLGTRLTYGESPISPAVGRLTFWTARARAPPRRRQ